MIIQEVESCYNDALLEASENGFVEVVEYLLDNGANIHALDYTAHINVINGQLDMIKYFITKGVNLHYENDLPLRIASEKGQLEIVKILVDNGLDVNAYSDYCIKKASENNHIEVVKYLIENGANSKFIKNIRIRTILGLPKWKKKPDNLDFRINTECSICGEVLNKNVKQLGCSSCRNTFKLDALEHWLSINYRCPYCNSSDEFYLLYD
jgi:ankyrin repeat protein